MYIYPNTLHTFNGNPSVAIASGYIYIEQQVYEDLVETKKMWLNGEIVDDPTYEERKRQRDEEEARRKQQQAIADEVYQLKQDLRDLDYKTIKYTQGKLSQEEFEQVIEICEQKRARINELING